MPRRRRKKPAGPLMTWVGLRVRQEREIQGWTQAQLAQRSGLSTTHISAIEVGGRGITLETADRLANGFGISLPELLQDPKGVDTQPELAVVERLRRRIAAMTPGEAAKARDLLEAVERFVTEQDIDET